MGYAPLEIQQKYPEIIPGVYGDVPNEEYHEADGLSSTNVRSIHKSIAHYEWERDHPSTQTDAMVLGSAFHALILEPDVYHEEYVVAPVKGKKTKAYGKCVADNPDKTILTSVQGDTLMVMRDEFVGNPLFKKIVNNTEAMREASIWYDDGLLLKCRPDIIHEGTIYDIKTTSGSVDERGFLQSVYKYKYHVQAPFYLYVAGKAGLRLQEFVFLCVQTVPPFLTAAYNINADLLQEGVDIIHDALDRYQNYVEGKDTWRGLPRGRQVVTL